MSADWWTVDRRDQVMGYGIRRGNRWAHITEVKDSGPGANSIRAICGGIMGLVHINSGLDLDDQAECETWKMHDVRFSLDCPIDVLVANERGKICPKCRTRYELKLAKEPACTTTAPSAATTTAKTANGSNAGQSTTTP